MKSPLVDPLRTAESALKDFLKQLAELEVQPRISSKQYHAKLLKLGKAALTVVEEMEEKVADARSIGAL